MTWFKSLLLASCVVFAECSESVLDIFYHSMPKGFCQGSLDVLFLQDTTATFKNDLPVVVDQLPDIVQQIAKVWPNSNFALAEFKDKPEEPLGYPDHDYCYRLVQSMTTNVKILQDSIRSLYTSAGGDLDEAQYEALFNAMYDKNVGWRADNYESAEDAQPYWIGKFVVLITDARPHFAEEAIKLYNLPERPAHPGHIWQNRFDEFCQTFDYPSPEQLKAAVDETGTKIIMLVRPSQNNVMPAWTWINENLLGQPSFMLKSLEQNSTNFASLFESTMKDLHFHACEKKLAAVQSPPRPKYCRRAHSK